LQPWVQVLHGCDNRCVCGSAGRCCVEIHHPGCNLDAEVPRTGRV